MVWLALVAGSWIGVGVGVRQDFVGLAGCDFYSGVGFSGFRVCLLLALFAWILNLAFLFGFVFERFGGFG